MKIDNIRQNYTKLVSNNGQKTNRHYFAAQNFTGIRVPDEIIEKELSKLIRNPFVRFMKFIKEQEGEIFNTTFNAFGTGLIAPLFIKHNPLSKTDEDTRTYSAWRQPVSAVLAVATQAAAVVPFNSWITKWANQGALPIHLNKTLFQEEKYIKTQVKKLHPDWDEKAVENKTKIIQKQQADTLEKMIQDGKLEYKVKNGKSIIITEKDPQLKNSVLKTLEKLIKNQNEEFEKCTEVTAPKKLARARFYRSYPQESQNLLESLINKFNELMRLEKPKNDSSAKKYKKFLKETIKDLKNNKAHPELINIAKEVNEQFIGNTLGPIKGKLSGMHENWKIYSKIKNDAEISSFIFENRIMPRQRAISRALDVLNEVKIKIKEGSMTIAEADTFIKGKIKLVESMKEESRLKNFVHNFPKAIRKTLEEGTKRNTTGFKAQSGLIVALLMLPITCSLLNWVYPRFMDWAFPNLSNKKHNNTAKEMIDQANKNSEVKS